MVKAKKEINKYGCNCEHGTKPVPSMYHQLTCPKKAVFLLGCSSDQIEYNFVRHYGKSVTVPNLESIKKFGGQMAEMMQCDCGHWFPRWVYYRCPSCWEGH